MRCLCLLILLCPVLVADENDRNFTALNAEQAGRDFAAQGEYSGTLRVDGNDVKVGVQIIAEGAGKFAWKALPGGLPGDGWNTDSEVLQGKGAFEGDVAVMTGDNGRGEIRQNRLVLINADGQEWGQLEKVMRKSPTLGKAAPEGAVVLFDGSSADQFENGRLTEDKLLMQGTTSKQKFADGQLHLEFMLPFMPNARGQGRGNSGVYLQGRYEVQVLDSFGLSGEQNECGGIYSIAKPLQNMCYPPLLWQTYDVDFHAAKFGDDGKKSADGWMTVRHNGVVIHDQVKLTHATTAAPVKEGAEPGPLYLQDHGNQVRYRNIWFVPASR